MTSGLIFTAELNIKKKKTHHKQTLREIWQEQLKLEGTGYVWNFTPSLGSETAN